MEGWKYYFRKTISFLVLSEIVLLSFVTLATSTQAQAAPPAPTPTTPSVPTGSSNPFEVTAESLAQDTANCHVPKDPGGVSKAWKTTDGKFGVTEIRYSPDLLTITLFATNNGIPMDRSFRLKSGQSGDATNLIYNLTLPNTSSVLVVPKYGGDSLNPWKILDKVDGTEMTGAGTFEGNFNSINASPDCQIYAAADERLNSVINGGDQTGPSGAPRITVPGNPAMGRPTIRYALTYLVAGENGLLNAFNRGGEFYFTFETVLDSNGQAKSLPEYRKYKHFAVRVSVGLDILLHAVYYGDIRNPGDDSDKAPYQLRSFRFAGIIIPNDELLPHLINRAYNRSDGTKVGPPPATTNLADYTGTWNNTDTTAINLYGYGSIPNIPSEQTSGTPEGWLHSWGVTINTTSILNPTGVYGLCSGMKFSGGGIDVIGPAINYAICWMLSQMYYAADWLFNKAVDWLTASIGLQYKDNTGSGP